MRKPSAAKRQRVDLRRLPYGAGYLIALVVVAVVLYLAYRASAGEEAPAWWAGYAVPAIYWSSPFLVAIAIAYRVRQQRKRRQMDDSSGT